jgi:hypothetical protein
MRILVRLLDFGTSFPLKTDDVHEIRVFGEQLGERLHIVAIPRVFESGDNISYGFLIWTHSTPNDSFGKPLQRSFPPLSIAPRRGNFAGYLLTTSAFPAKSATGESIPPRKTPLLPYGLPKRSLLVSHSLHNRRT